jgi:carbon storage regulator
MLVLTRAEGEEVIIGGIIRVVVVDVRGDRVRLGFAAPEEITVHRLEVYNAIKREGGGPCTRRRPKPKEGGAA